MAKSTQGGRSMTLDSTYELSKHSLLSAVKATGISKTKYIIGLALEDIVDSVALRVCLLWNFKCLSGIA